MKQARKPYVWNSDTGPRNYAKIVLDSDFFLCYSFICVKAKTIKQSIRSHLATIEFASVHSPLLYRLKRVFYGRL